MSLAAGLHSKRNQLFLIAILWLAFGLRLVYVRGRPAETVLAKVDAKGYYLLAENLLKGGPPSLLSGVRTPLYPAFLALILSMSGTSTKAIPLVQAGLDTATTALVCGLVTRLVTLRRGLLAALLYAINPVSFLFIGQALTEILLAFLMTLAFYLFLITLEGGRRHPPLLVMVGIVSGLCILCKPNVVGLPLILALGLLVCRRHSIQRVWREALLLVGVALLTLLPWLIRNRLVFGEWFLSLAFETTVARVSAVSTILEANGERAAPWTPRWEEVYRNDVAAIAERRYGWVGDGDNLSEALRRLHETAAVARDIIRQHPQAFAAAHLKGVLRSFAPSLHRNWYARFTGTSWPQSESSLAILARWAGEMARGNWSVAQAVIADWWQPLPTLARWLWPISVVLYAPGFCLLIAGLWALRTRPGVVLSLGLTFLYLAFMPGPIAQIRFWMPGVPLAIGVMACAFAKGKVRGIRGSFA